MHVVIRFYLSRADLTRIRFAQSPLWETVGSLRPLAHGESGGVHDPWVAGARAATADLDLRAVTLLCSQRGYVPDFLTPPPEEPAPSFASELARLRAWPAERARSEVLALFGGRLPTTLQRFDDAPQPALAAIAETVEAYWDRALAPHWPRIQALLSGDVLYRSHRLARGGAEALFADLHPRVRYADGVLELDKWHDHDSQPTGRGLVLVPVAFWQGLAATIDPGLQPALCYQPRGLARLWRGRGASEAAREDAALAELLGDGRAAVLRCLAGPSTTGDVAARLAVSPSAVSQHLGVLRRSGLVEPQRLGRRVYYRLSPRGDGLLRLFEPGR